jgi:hypothetical protein
MTPIPTRWFVVAVLFRIVSSLDMAAGSSLSESMRMSNTNNIKKKKATPSPSSLPLLQRPELVTKSLHNKDDIFYFGLGSNMLRSKLENRSICGTKIHIKSMQPALVKNYRLAFNMRGIPPLEPGMGSLEPVTVDRGTANTTNNKQNIVDSSTSTRTSKPLIAYKESECHGALVRLSAQDYEKVMRSEGVGSGRQDQGYEEVVVTAVPYKGGRPVQAVALRAREHVRLNFDPAPSRRYMNILRQGAQELGLAPCYQEFLRLHPVAQASAVTRRLAVCNLVLTIRLSILLKTRIVSKVQAWLLWRVYVPPTSTRLPKVLSEFATAAILLPLAIPGSLLLKYMSFTNSTSSTMMKSLIDSHW